MNQIGGDPFTCVQLSPSVEEEGLWTRFGGLVKQAEFGHKHLVIKIEELADKEPETFYQLNKILFMIGHFKLVEFSNMIYSFPKDTRIYFEVSNCQYTLSQLSIQNLQTVKCDFSFDKIQLGSKGACNFTKFACYMEHLITPLVDNQSNLEKIDWRSKSSKKSKKIIQIVEKVIAKKFKKLDSKKFKKLSFRELKNYLKYVNRSFDLINNNLAMFSEGRFKGKMSSILECILVSSFQVIFPTLSAIQKQNLAILRFGNNYDETFETKEKIKANEKKEIKEWGHLFLNEGGLSYYLDDEPKDNQINGLIAKIFDLEASSESQRGLDKSQDHFIKKLCEYSGKSEDETKLIIENTNQFNGGKGYVLNKDNMIKILLIHQKLEANLPILIMGETGCGKTYLLEYYAKVIKKGQVEFETYVLHAGVTEEALIKYIQAKIKKAKEFSEQKGKTICD